MFTHTRLSVMLVLLAAFLFTSASFAQEKKKPNEDQKDKKEEVKVLAKQIDFNAQLGSPSVSLKELGNLIDEARRSADVVSLLSASMTLFLEEKATGRSAQITAKDLLKEATAMAKNQKNIKALQQCQLLWENTLFANDKKAGAELADAIKIIEADLAAVRGGGAKVVDVKVENRSSYTVYVYIDGVYKGYVNSMYYVVYTNIGLGWTSFYAETDNMWSSSAGKYIYYKWSNSYNLQDYDLSYTEDFTWTIY